MARTGENRQNVGHDRSKIVDLLRIRTKDAFSNLNEIVKAAGELHAGNSSDHRGDDEDHVPGNIARLHAEKKTKDEHAETAGVANTDAAETDTEEDRAEQDNDLKNKHEIHNASRHG